MNKKNLTFALVIIILILKTSTVFASEVQLPSIVGLPNINQGNATLANFAEYFFGLGVYVVGSVATIAFAIGAAELIFSGGSPDLASEAKDRMKGAILGVIVAILAGLILNMINGNIGHFNLNALPTPSPTQAFEQPGVYFCTDGCDGTKCKGTMSSVMTSDQDPINTNFIGKVKGVRIVEDLSSKIVYGVILHGDSLASTSDCSQPIYDKSTSPGAVDCESVSASINTTAANIFTIGNNSGGNGVSFYSDVNGWSNTIFSGGKILSTAGVVKVKGSQINPVFSGNASGMKYDYSESNVPPDKQAVDKTVQNALGSIFIGSDGGYLVAIYSGSSSASANSSGIQNQQKYILADMSFKQLADNVCNAGQTQPCDLTSDGSVKGQNVCVCNDQGCYWDRCSNVPDGGGGGTGGGGGGGGAGGGGGGGGAGGGGASSGTYCRTFTSSISNTGSLGIAGPNGSQLSSIYVFSTR